MNIFRNSAFENRTRRDLLACVVFLLAACGGGGGGGSTSGSGGGASTASYAIAGTVSGLSTGDSLELQDDAGDNTTISVNGPFTFSKKIASGSKYAVSILAQPNGETCALAADAQGVVSASDVEVGVSCSTSTIAQATSRYMYLDSGFGQLVQLGIAADGSLSILSHVPLSQATANSGSGYFNETNIAPSSDGKSLFASAYGYGEVTAYTIASDGTLAATNPPTFTSATPYPWGVYSSPTADFLYVDDPIGTISQFQVNSTGALTLASSPSINSLTAGAYYEGVENLKIHPSGRFAYAVLESTTADSTGYLHHDLVVFDIGTNGQLSYRPNAALEIETAYNVPAVEIVISPAGDRIYAADLTGANVFQFAVASDGSISPLANASISVGVGAASAWSILVSPSGAGAYIVDITNNLIWQYEMDSNGGLVTASVPTISACPGSISSGNPAFAAFDPVSSILYVTCSSITGIRSFGVNADSTLTVLKDTNLEPTPLTLGSLIFDPHTFAIVK